MGPGTHVRQKVLDRIKPLDQSDASAMIHDIEYLVYPNQKLPDKTAVDNAGIWKYPMKLGFYLKEKKGYPQPLDPISYEMLKDIVDYAPEYNYLSKYNLKWSDGSKVVKGTSKPILEETDLILSSTESIEL